MKISDEYVLREIAGEHIVVPVGAAALRIHGMVSLSESGYLLFKKLQEGSTEEELVKAILSEYAVDKEVAMQDVREFVGQMQQVGILEQQEN